MGPLLNRKGDLSDRNRLLLYKQLIRPMMDYACVVWRSVARSHIWRLQVLESKCLRLATGALWYVSNRQIHEDLGVPLFADDIRALTARFDSKLADVGNPPSAATRQILTLTEGWLRQLTWKPKGGRVQQGSRGHRSRWPSRLNESRSALISQTPFGYTDWGFPLLFPVVRQMPGYKMQSRGTADTPTPQAGRLHLSAWKKSHTPSLRLDQSGLRTQTDNQAKFIPPIISPGSPMR